MRTPPIDTTAAAARGHAGALAAGHMLLVVAILLLCTLAPKSGQPALLLPLPGLATADVTAFARHHDLRLLGRGRAPGSLVVADAGPERMADAICAGLLLIHVPGTLCAPAPTSH